MARTFKRRWRQQYNNPSQNKFTLFLSTYQSVFMWVSDLDCSTLLRRRETSRRRGCQTSSSSSATSATPPSLCRWSSPTTWWTDWTGSSRSPTSPCSGTSWATTSLREFSPGWWTKCSAWGRSWWWPWRKSTRVEQPSRTGSQTASSSQAISFLFLTQNRIL